MSSEFQTLLLENFVVMINMYSLKYKMKGSQNKNWQLHLFCSRESMLTMHELNFHDKNIITFITIVVSCSLLYYIIINSEIPRSVSLAQTCIYLRKLAQTCASLLKLAHTCIYLCKLAHTCASLSYRS